MRVTCDPRGEMPCLIRSVAEFFGVAAKAAPAKQEGHSPMLSNENDLGLIISATRARRHQLPRRVAQQPRFSQRKHGLEFFHDAVLNVHEGSQHPVRSRQYRDTREVTGTARQVEINEAAGRLLHEAGVPFRSALCEEAPPDDRKSYLLGLALQEHRAWVLLSATLSVQDWADHDQHVGAMQLAPWSQETCIRVQTGIR